MKTWRPLALLLVPAAAGALGTLLAAAAAGMHADDLRHILWLIVPALLATVAAIAVVRLILAHVSVRQGMATVSFVGAAVALANLAVLSAGMFVSSHDATIVAVFVVYSAGAGLGAALALAGAQARAIDRLSATARQLAAGDLTARVGRLDAGRSSPRWARSWTTWPPGSRGPPPGSASSTAAGAT